MADSRSTGSWLAQDGAADVRLHGSEGPAWVERRLAGLPPLVFEAPIFVLSIDPNASSGMKRFLQSLASVMVR